MARTKRSSDMFSKAFVKAVKTAVNDHLEKGDMETCVSAALVADHKEVAKAFTVSQPKLLRTLVMAAVRSGQVQGLDSRKGRDGGLFRVAVATKRKPVVKDAVPDNDVAEAATGTDQ